MFDVFYTGKKPNLFAHEQECISVEDAGQKSRTRYFWMVNYLTDYTGFDFLWEPSPWQAHFKHAWPSQNQQDSQTYLIPRKGYTETHYNRDFILRDLPVKEYWTIPDYIDPESIDWTWAPDPLSPPYRYHFPVSWNWHNVGGPVYSIPGATEDKYVQDFTARTLADLTRWQIPPNIDIDSFDFSWRPHPLDPPFIYRFPTVWNAEGGPEYHVPGATEVKYTDEQTAQTLPDRSRWTVPEEIDENLVDFSWVPHPRDPAYIYHFATEYQASVGLTYTVPGATEIKFAGDIPQKNKESAVRALDIFYLDRSNSASEKRFAELKEKYPEIQRVRYVNSAMDTIKRCVSRAKTSRFWVVGSLNDYSDFDFAWHTAPWQSQMTHVFGTQWNKWSDTFLINRWEFERNAKWAKGIEEFPNLNFVKDQQVVAPADASDIYIINFGNSEAEKTITDLTEKYRVVKTARYFDNYLATLKRIVKDIPDDQEHVWVVASICDYNHFDFSWQPEAWQSKMIHVFPSNEQKFGDTFYIDVAEFKEQMNQLELLDWFETVNYCTDQTVSRWPLPVIKHTNDTQVNIILASDFTAPLAVFTNNDIDIKKIPTVSIWREKTRTIVPLDAGAGTVIVPKGSIAYIKDQLYDYPYIDKTKRNIFDSELQDVVFISYDEPDADRNWALLKEQCPRAQRVHGVAGMERALEAAADISRTPWYYAVFAKTKIYESFDFSFVPDRMQQPKHYIFNSRNTVNGLEYGHMGIVMYNCAGIKQMNKQGNFGLDYTLSFPHDSIPLLSCYGSFDQSPYHTWRTSFRESAKLAYFEHVNPTVDGAYRLNVWLTVANGDYAEWSLRGAEDGVEFFEQSGRELDILKQSFKWEWLRTYFVNKYGELE